MKGQWIGKYSVTNPSAITSNGQITLNIDEFSDHFGGSAYMFPDVAYLPSVAAIFRTRNKADNFEFETSLIFPIDPITRLRTNWDEIKLKYPGIALSSKAIVKGRFSKTELIIDATTDINSRVQATIDKEVFTDKSSVESIKKTWNEYKAYVGNLKGSRLLFRGQNAPWKLRTAFHRGERYDLNRFLLEDIPALHRNLSAKTSHVFNLDNAREYGAFLNLAQHHGYPTPLLDWTYSPYVAAFFAFRGIPKKHDKKGHVRVYIFDHMQWLSHWQQVYRLDSTVLHLSILDFPAIENQRVVPQQAATTVTNIDDIEAHIKRTENIRKGAQYLSAIDIDVKERDEVMKELAYMGITAGSMFPGLDGACEELRERFF